MWSPSFWGISFWSPWFWGGPLAPVPPPPAQVAEGLRRDDKVIADIAARLRATNLFDRVTERAGPDEIQAPATDGAVAWIQHESWTKHDRVMPVDFLWDSRYTLTIRVRWQDPAERGTKMDRAIAAAHNVLEDKQLANFCLPRFSRLKNGVRNRAVKHPELEYAMPGRYMFRIGAPTNHDDSE